MKTTTKLNLRKALLAGTAIVAVGAFSTGAHAANQELTGPLGTPNAIADPAGDEILNAVDDQASAADAGSLDITTGATASNLNSDTDGSLAIIDSNDAANVALAFSGFGDITSGTTFTFLGGDTIADGTGTSTTDPDFSVTFAGDIADANATTQTRGGTLAILGAANSLNASTFTFAANGNVLLDAASFVAGAAGAAQGTAITATLGNAAGDAIDVTTLTATGGAGSVAVAGAATGVTVTGTLAVGTGGIDIDGGAGGTSAVGGASKITVTPAVATLTGNTTIDGGAAGSTTGIGGAAELELTGGLTGGTGNFTVTGGIGASGAGAGDGGLATLDSDAAFTTTGSLTFAGGAGGAGTTDAADGGNSVGEFAASLSAGAVTLTGGDAGAAAANEGGDATVVVATTSAMSALTVTGGNGGTFAGAAIGGTSAFTSTGASTITGAISVTGGNGSTNDAADGGAASALFTAGVTATGQTLTITGGNGDAAAAGDGGAASVELNDASTFGAIVLDDGTDGTATGGEATLTVDLDGTAAKAIAGTITAGADGEGTLTIENTEGNTNHVTFGGNIGTSTVRLQAINVGTAADGAHATFSGEVHADAFDVDGQDDVSAAIFSENVSVGATFLIDAGAANASSATFKKNVTGGAFTLEATGGSATATFDGSTAQTVTSTFVGGGANEGAIVIGDGAAASDVTFTGILGTGAGLDLATLNVMAGAKATFGANATFDGAWTNAGTTEVSSGATLNAATWTDTAGSKVVFGVSNADGGNLVAGDYGHLNVAGGGAIDSDDASINVTGLLGTIDGTADAVLTTLTFDEAKDLDDNSALYTFTAALNGEITAAQVSTESITDNAGTKATADELLSIGSEAEGNLLLVQNAFAAAGTGTMNDVLEAAASDVAGGAAAAGFSVSNQTSGINAQRLAALRDGSAATGMSAGNGAQGLKVWGQAFGSQGDQDQRDGVSGYDVDTYGVAVGMDSENIGDNMVVGLAFAYADTEVDSDSISNANTEVDSYQVSLYGDYDLDERTYLAGQLGYTWSDVDTTRNPGGLTGITANGDYDSSQINARVELGRDYQTGSAILTPSILANYVHYDADSYTETGAGTANVAVNSENLNLFEIGVGVDASWKIENADGSYVKPVLSVGVRHDLIGDEFESTNTFQNAGATSFKVKGFDPAQTTFDVGAGVTYFTNSGWDLTAEADYEMKSDYDAISGLVKASYNF